MNTCSIYSLDTEIDYSSCCETTRVKTNEQVYTEEDINFIISLYEVPLKPVKKEPLDREEVKRNKWWERLVGKKYTKVKTLVDHPDYTGLSNGFKKGDEFYILRSPNRHYSYVIATDGTRLPSSSFMDM